MSSNLSCFASTGLVTLYLFNNIVDAVSLGVLLEEKLIGNKLAKQDINYYFLIVLLIVNIIIETYTFYYKYITTSQKLSTFVYKLNINWYCVSLAMYIVSLILNFDANTFTTTQKIIFPLIKTCIIVINIYACKIRYTNVNVVLEKPKYLESTNDDYSSIV